MYISADALLGLERIHQRALSVAQEAQAHRTLLPLRSCIAKTEIPSLLEYCFRTLLRNLLLQFELKSNTTESKHPSINFNFKEFTNWARRQTTSCSLFRHVRRHAEVTALASQGLRTSNVSKLDPATVSPRESTPSNAESSRPTKSATRSVANFAAPYLDYLCSVALTSSFAGLQASHAQNVPTTRSDPVNLIRNRSGDTKSSRFEGSGFLSRLLVQICLINVHNIS